MIEDRCIGLSARGRGRSKASSMSNTRKRTARRKNRIENGRRALFFGSNPHSNGEAFSRSINDRAETDRTTITRRRITRIAIRMFRIINFIIRIDCVCSLFSFTCFRAYCLEGNYTGYTINESGGAKSHDQGLNLRQ